MSNKLNIKICNTVFKNPIISLSGCYGFVKELNSFIKPGTLGAVTLKGLTLEPRDGNKGNRICETPSGMLNSIGLENPGIEKFIKDIYPTLNSKDQIIININGNTIEEYVELAKKINKLKNINFVELNISCPNVKCGGMSFGVDKEMVQKITSKVKKELTSKKLIVKLSPNVTNIKEIAIAAENGGADALSLINTVLAMDIDIKNKKPALGNVYGGLSGPAIFPIALRMVHQVYQVVNIPIIACGGVSTFSDVIKMIMAGASLVGIGSMILSEPKIPMKIINELEEYCIENKIKNISELIGVANEKRTS